LPDGGEALPPPRSTTESLRRRAEAGDTVAQNFLNRRTAKDVANYLPSVGLRREAVAMKRGAPGQRLLDIRAGRRESPEEHAARMQSEAYTNQAMGTAIAGAAQGGPLTPEQIQGIGGLFGRGLPRPSAEEQRKRLGQTATNRDEFVQQGVEAGLGTRQELEAQADQLYGPKKSLWESIETTGESLQKNPWYAHNFPWLKSLSEWIAGKVMPPPPKAQGSLPPEVLNHIRQKAAEGNARAQQFLQDHGY